MRAGKLRYKIDFYDLVTVRDEYSGFGESYVLYLSTWADVKYLSGGEGITNAQIFPSTTIQFEVRYRTGINEKMRIKFNDVDYNITFIENNANKSLRITTNKVSE